MRPQDTGVIPAAELAVRRGAAVSALLAQPSIAYAAPPGTGYGEMLISLVVVLGVFVALAWLLRRVLPGVARGPLRVVATQPVGARERIVLVELAGEWLVLGVGGGRVNLLTRLLAPSSSREGEREKEPR